MSNQALPSYVSMAKPNPATNRAPWYKNTAPTYAGIFLWFVFWSQAPSGGSGIPGGVLSQGIESNGRPRVSRRKSCSGGATPSEHDSGLVSMNIV